MNIKRLSMLRLCSSTYPPKNSNALAFPIKKQTPALKQRAMPIQNKVLDNAFFAVKDIPSEYFYSIQYIFLFGNIEKKFNNLYIL